MKAFFREPVFVDPTGRRSRTIRRAGVLVVAPTSAYLLLMVSSVLGGPTIDTPLLPPAAADRAPAGAVEGGQPVVQDTRVGPVVPTPSQVRITIGAVTADSAGKATDSTAAKRQPGAAGVAPAGKPAARTTSRPATSSKAQAPKQTTTTQETTAKPAAKPPVEQPAEPPSSSPPAAEPPAVKPPAAQPPAEPSTPRPSVRPLAPVVEVVTPVLEPVLDPVGELVGGVGGLLGLGK